MVEVRTAKQLTDLKNLLKCGGDVSIAVAYVTRSGLNLIEDELEVAIGKGKVRMLIFLDGRVTDPEALHKLMDFSKRGLKVKYYDISGGIFHPKLYMFRSNGSTTFLNGSFNLTGPALRQDNVEHGLYVSYRDGEVEDLDVIRSFNKWWNKKGVAKILTAKKVKEYDEQYSHTVTMPKDERTVDQKNYWLFKCNPAEPYTLDPTTQYYDFSKLKAIGLDSWGEKGLNNPSKKLLRERVRMGEHVLFYHTRPKADKLRTAFPNGDFPALGAIVGTASVEEEFYGEWNRPLVRIRYRAEFEHPVTLREICMVGDEVVLRDLASKLRGEKDSGTSTQTSILKVTQEEFYEILKLGKPRPISTD